MADDKSAFPPAPPAEELANKARLESFSDNVISIAITLLVLDVRLPGGFTDLTVLGILRELAPRLAAFVLSFAIVGVYWVGHHLVMQSFKLAPRSLLWTNNLFLLFISLIPASAALLGAHPQRPASAILYGLNLALVVAALLLFQFVGFRYHQRWGLTIDPVAVRRGYRRSSVGLGIALVGVALAAVSPRISYAVYWVTPLSYVVVQLLPYGGRSGGG